jgi:hypothetical protein
LKDRAHTGKQLANVLHKHEEDYNEPGGSDEKRILLLALLLEDSAQDRHKYSYSRNPEHQIQPHCQALLYRSAIVIIPPSKKPIDDQTRQSRDAASAALALQPSSRPIARPMCLAWSAASDAPRR